MSEQEVQNNFITKGAFLFCLMNADKPMRWKHNMKHSNNRASSGSIRPQVLFVFCGRNNPNRI